MKYEIQKKCNITVYEIIVAWNEWNFSVVYGKGINGWFISIPNWEICVESACPWNDMYNASKLGKHFNNYDKGKAIAMAIKEHWEQLGECVR